MTRPRCILLLGAPRTGTTLIAAALGSNAAVAMMDEDFSGAARWITGNKIAGNKLCVPNQVQFSRRWSPLYKPMFLNGVFRKRVGYRLPRSRLSVRDYTEIFDCSVVCLLRDPARAVDSIAQRERFPRRRAIDVLRRCYETYDEARRHQGERCAFLSFDRFLIAPEDSARSLCDWLAIPYDAAMLAAPGNNSRYRQSGFDVSKATATAGAGRQDRPADLADLDAAYGRFLAAAL